jgi:superfamily II DNA or RNA helicase
MSSNRAGNRFLRCLPVLHDYQQAALRYALEWFDKPTSVKRYGICSPTGTGKSYICLALLGELFNRRANPYLITPKLDIVIDMLAKLGVNVDGISVGNIEDFMQIYHIYTPTRFKNRVMAGVIDVQDIKTVIIDEAHHDEADGYKLIEACLPDDIRIFGTSATFYRGNPKDTALFRARWPKIHQAITEQEAYERGFLALPTCDTIPLVDDDLIEIGANGEFVVSRVTAATKDKLAYLFGILKSEYKLFNSDGTPKRPTLFGIHSSEIIPYFQMSAEAAGLPVSFITESTSIRDRRKLFTATLNCSTSLVHINTVSEGVDLSSSTARLRVYIDLASCNSPLLFMQRFGRPRRPLLSTETEQPLYLCCNRNLERHGYLLDGLLPAEQMRKAQLAFDKPTERSKTRVFGIESLGKLKPTNVTLTSGIQVQTFAVSLMKGNEKQSYLVLLHPCQANPVWFRKTVPRGADGTLDYSMSKWELEREPPQDMKGFKSNPPSPLTEPQQRFWNRCAEKVGLQVSQNIDAKKFQLLPALLDIGAVLE